jgi:hypothetical protein
MPGFRRMGRLDNADLSALTRLTRKQVSKRQGGPGAPPSRVDGTRRQLDWQCRRLTVSEVQHTHHGAVVSTSLGKDLWVTRQHGRDPHG